MYSQSITRNHRTAFIIALDRSGSMCELIETLDGPRTKAEMVCEITNSLLFELIEHARRSDGVHDYYDVAVIGYSGHGVEPLLDQRWFLPISELAAIDVEYRTRVVCRPTPDGGQGVLRLSLPEWIRPDAAGKTPMYELFCRLHELVKEWCADPRHEASSPPVIFNITDGEASDCTPDGLREITRTIRREGTADGEVLLLNCHLSSQSLQPSILFPRSVEEVQENRYARLLYDCSSELPPIFEGEIRQLRGDHLSGPFRGMSYNCSIQELISLLNIGTISRPLY